MIKKLKTFFQKYWLFVLLGSILGLVSVLFTTPKPIPTPVVSQLPAPKAPNFPELGQAPTYRVFLDKKIFANLPTTMPVYKTKFYDSNQINQDYQKLIQDLGFFESGQEKKIGDAIFLEWSSKNNLLTINLPSGHFSFAGEVNLNQKQSQILTPTQIQEIIQTKLFDWQLVSEKPQVERLQGFYLFGQELEPAKDITQANVFHIVFNPKFNQYPIIGFGKTDLLIQAKITHQGVLLSFSFSLHQIEEKPIDNYLLKSYEEIKNSLENGQFQLLKIYTADKEPRSLSLDEKIQQVTVNDIKIAYYETAELQEFYQPIFFLKGNVTLQDEKVYQAEFTLPAIASQWLTPEL